MPRQGLASTWVPSVNSLSQLRRPAETVCSLFLVARCFHFQSLSTRLVCMYSCVSLPLSWLRCMYTRTLEVEQFVFSPQ